MPDPDPYLEEAAGAAREAYCREMNDYLRRVRGERDPTYGRNPLPWDGGRDAAGTRRQPQWPRLAAFARDRGLDLGRLVRACFRARGRAAPPTPPQCMTAAAAEIYHDSSETAEAAAAGLAALLRSQAALFAQAVVLRDIYRVRLGWSRDDVVRSVLADDTLQLSALFRYCVARREGYDDLAVSYQDAARRQHATEAAPYDAAWGDWLPDGPEAAAPRRGDRR